MKKSLGSITDTTIKLSSPKIDFENMKFNKIMLLVGQNGAGKTFLLKSTWFVATTFFLKFVDKAKIFGGFGIQFLFDNTFGKGSGINGSFTYNYSCGSSFNIVLNNGIIVSNVTALAQGVEIASMPIFMSRETRRFTNIIQYLKFKTILKLDVNDNDNFKTLMDTYRLYDIMLMEIILGKIPSFTPESYKLINAHMHKFDKDFHTITEMKIVGTSIVYSTKDLVDRNITFLGAGHQALLTMCIGGPLGN